MIRSGTVGTAREGIRRHPTWFPYFICHGKHELVRLTALHDNDERRADAGSGIGTNGGFSVWRRWSCSATAMNRNIVRSIGTCQ